MASRWLSSNGDKTFANVPDTLGKGPNTSSAFAGADFF
jgi:hypothetical protein